MTGDDLTRLLTAAAQEAEPDAPAVDPLGALARARHRQQRRGHLAALSFVVFVLALQAAAPDAAGASGVVAAAASTPAGTSVGTPVRPPSASGLGPRG